MRAGSGGADSCSLVSVARYGPAISGGSAASKMDSAWPSFMAPPLSSPRTRKIWSAVRCCISCATISAGLPPIRFPIPMAVRPASPIGSLAIFAARVTGFLGTSFTPTILPHGQRGRYEPRSDQAPVCVMCSSRRSSA